MTAPGPAWSAQEEELLRSLAAAGESAAAISTLLKRSPHAVRTRAKVLKIKLARSQPGRKLTQNGDRRWTAQEDERLLALVDAEATWPLIAITLKRTVQSAQERAKKLRANG